MCKIECVKYAHFPKSIHIFDKEYQRIASRQCMLAMKLEDIDTKNFDTWLAKCQIHQNFPYQ